MGSEASLRVEPLSSDHDIESFRGRRAADGEYLRLYALTDQGLRRARTFVALREDRLLAYFTIMAGSVEAASSRADVARRRRKPLVPVVIIGRLVVDRAAQDQGLEEAILRQALGRSVAGAEAIGAGAVVVATSGEDDGDNSGKDDSLFRRYGFEALPACPFHLFRPL